MTDHEFFEKLLIILGGSLCATILFRRFRLPPIVAYISVGMFVGPEVLGWIHEPEDFALIAEFGVAFLLFSIGLEFSLSKMLSLRFAVFGLGTAQVAVCTGVFALAVFLWGQATPETVVVVAGALALSSTAIVTRELSDQQQFESRYAQLALGVLLFQDLIAVVFLVLVPIFGGTSQGAFWLLVLTSLGKSILLFAILMAVGKWLLPPVYQEVARGSSDEVFVLSTLFIVLLAAWLTYTFGLSMALGGFAIGMMLSESPFKHQIVSDIRPFRDILLGLFFVTVGINIEVSLLGDYGLRILVFTVALIVIKAVVVAAVVWMMGEPGTVPLRVGLALAQAGEFGLALIALGRLNNVIPSDQASFIALIAIFSMLTSPILIRHSNTIAEALLFWLPQGGMRKATPAVTLHQADHVVIGGFGRVGQTITELMEANHIPYIAIDRNIDLVREGRSRGRNVVYGNATHVDILRSCHIDKAKLAVLTFRSADLATGTVQQIRSKGIQTPIIVRCHEYGDFNELISIGADHVVPEMLEASLIISSHVLTMLGVPGHLIEQQLEAIRDRHRPTSSKSVE